MKTETESVLLKLIVCGDSCVGKSLFCHKITTNDSEEIGKRRYVKRTDNVGFSAVAYEPTIGLDMAIIRRRLSASTIAKVHIWDTSGDPRYLGIISSYYGSCCAAIVIVNASEEGALDSTKKWVKDLRSKSRSDGRSLIIGLFVDVGDGKHKRSESIAKFCDKLSVHYFEVQIRQNKNLEESLGSLLNTIYETYITQGLETEGIGLIGCDNTKMSTGIHPLINRSDDDEISSNHRIQNNCCTIL
jgi:GTPase SAR1 family protein